MYRYKIGYYSYEESAFVELEHEQKFTQQEITELVAEATVEAVKLAKKDNAYIHNFQDVFHGNFHNQDIVTYLVENKGFKRIEYTEEWSVFGWASIFDKGDWGHEGTPELNIIVDKVNQAGFSVKDDSFLNYGKVEQNNENKSE